MSDTTPRPAAAAPTSVGPLDGFGGAELEAGLFAAALPYLAEWGLEPPPLDEVLDALGVDRERATEAEAAFQALLPAVLPRPDERILALNRAVVAYLQAHPGAVKERRGRWSYSASFRRFVLDLRERHGDVDLDDFAAAVGVAKRTLLRWLRQARRR